MAVGFLDQVLNLLEAFDTRIFGKVFIKAIGQPFNGQAVYTSAVQNVCESFQQYLQAQDDRGLVIADSRFKNLNSSVAHSVFTQRFQASGDRYSRLLEMPLFGHAENHAVMQLTDILCSALLFPMAIGAYCQGIVQSIHLQQSYAILHERYGERLRQREFRFQTANKGSRGGVSVSDKLGEQMNNIRQGIKLFKP